MKNQKAASLVGSEVLGWILVEYIDSGASADVFRGVCDEAEAAVKVYRAWVTDEDPTGARLSREIESLRAIDHPHVCRYLAAGSVTLEAEERRVLVMEFIRGQSLTEWIKQRGTLGWPEFRTPALQLLAAVRAMHDVGQRHRDIKPDNVRVEAQTDRIVLVDFGVVSNPEAAESDGLTASHQFLGTVRWSAPEWIYREPPEAAKSPQIDIYGIGATFYYAINGAELFEGIDNRAQLETAVRSKAVRFRPAGFPLRVQSALNATLSKQPDNRPGLEDLASAIAGAKDDPTNEESSPAALDLSAVFSGDEGRLVRERLQREAARLDAVRGAQLTLLKRWHQLLSESALTKIDGFEMFGQWDFVGPLFIGEDRCSGNIPARLSGALPGPPGMRFTGVVPLRDVPYAGCFVAVRVAGDVSSAEARRVFGFAYTDGRSVKVTLLPETLEVWTGELSEVLDDALNDADLRWESLIRLAVDENQTLAHKPPVLTELGLGLVAARLAEYLVRHSKLGRSDDPAMGPAEVRQLLRVPDERIMEAVDELSNKGWIRRTPGFAPLGFAQISASSLLFVEADALVLGFETAVDARRLAQEIAISLSYVASSDLSKRLGWPPRRLNPALSFLDARGLVKRSESVDRTFVIFQVARNERTRQFADAG